jgi:hypothetical protein
MPAQNPYINGNYYDFTTVQFLVGATRYFGIQDLNYKNTATFGKIRGASPYVRGRTRGIVDADGGFTMFLNEWDPFREALVNTSPGRGYMEIPFGISVSYGSTAQDMRTDTIIGARIKSDDYSNKEGSDALVVKVELDILQLVINGHQAMADSPFSF